MDLVTKLNDTGKALLDAHIARLGFPLTIDDCGEEEEAMLAMMWERAVCCLEVEKMDYTPDDAALRVAQAYAVLYGHTHTTDDEEVSAELASFVSAHDAIEHAAQTYLAEGWQPADSEPGEWLKLERGEDVRFITATADGVEITETYEEESC